MNELKVKAMELAIAATGHNLYHDPKSLVKLAAEIEAYLTGAASVGYTITGTVTTDADRKIAAWSGRPLAT